MKLEIDSEKVVRLAEKCPQWKNGLKELFPEVFSLKEDILRPENFYISHSSDQRNGIAIVYRRNPGDIGMFVGWVVKGEYDLSKIPAQAVKIGAGLTLIAYDPQ
jgi:hypothetical protein